MEPEACDGERDGEDVEVEEGFVEGVAEGGGRV